MTGAKKGRTDTTQIGDIPFILTHQVKDMGTACNSLIETNDMGLVYGEPGVGKTKTAQEMVSKWKMRNYPKGLYVAADVRITPLQMLKKILREYDDIRPANFDDAMRVIRTLVDKKNLDILIIDESERLSRDTLDLVRSIFDTTRLPILLIGMVDILQKLRSHKKFYSRIGIAYHYTALSFEQCEQYLGTFHPLLNQHGKINGSNGNLIEFIFKSTNGEFRRINRLIKQADRLRITNNRGEFSLATFKAASKLLLNP